MTNRPLITIGVPIYNVEKYLDECIDSIRVQTYDNLQIVLVNDGSPDNCLDICNRHAAQDSRITVVTQPNGGLSAARNTALDNARGQYIMFVDSDDIILPLMVQRLLDGFAVADDVQIVGSSFIPWRPGHKVHAPVPRTTVFDSPEDKTTAFFDGTIDRSSCTKLYRTGHIGDLRFVRGIVNEDFPFLTELYSRPGKMVYLPERFYRYRITEGSISHTFSARYFDMIDNVEREQARFAGAAPRLRRAYDLLRLRAHIDTAYRIVHYKKKNEFATRLKASRAYVRAHALDILRLGAGKTYIAKAILAFT